MSRDAVTSEGRTDALSAWRHVETVEGVNGAVIRRREILVVCDFRDEAAAVRSGMGDGEDGRGVDGVW